MREPLALPENAGEPAFNEPMPMIRVSEVSDNADMIAIFRAVCAVFEIQPIVTDERLYVPALDNVLAMRAARACREIRAHLSYRKPTIIWHFRRLFESMVVSAIDSGSSPEAVDFIEAASLAASELRNVMTEKTRTIR